MPTPLTRRIVRRAVIAVAGVVLQIVLCVANATSFVFACGAGWISPAARGAIYPVYAPLDLYVLKHYPGSGFIVDTMNWASKAGGKFVQ